MAPKHARGRWFSIDATTFCYWFFFILFFPVEKTFSGITNSPLFFCHLTIAFTSTCLCLLQIVGIVYSVFDMRGHVDMNSIEKQFDDSRKQMDKEENSLENQVEELRAAKQLADQLAAKLLVENSQLLKRVQELEEENKKLSASRGNRK